MYHYLYRITNKLEGKHYYGSRSSVVEPTSDLGVRYFSSSTAVRKDIRRLGVSAFKFKVVSYHDKRTDAYSAEERIQRRLRVVERPEFYNRSYQTNKFSWLGGKHTAQTRSKMSAQRKGRIPWNKGRHVFAALSDEERRHKFGSMGEDNPFYGKHHSPETRKKLSELSARFSGEKNSFYGKTHTAETRARLREATLHQFASNGHPRQGKTWRRVICENCGKDVSYPMFMRWHNGKCKS